MLEKNDQELRKEIKIWVGQYYLSEGVKRLAKVSCYYDRFTNKIILANFGFFIVFFLTAVINKPKGGWLLATLGGYLIVNLAVYCFWEKKDRAYWQTSIPTPESLAAKTEETMDTLPALNKSEAVKIRELIRLSKNKFVTREAFIEEIEEALKLGALGRWSFLQEFKKRLEEPKERSVNHKLV